MSALLTRRLFNIEDYMRMADAGVFRNERVELIDGEIVTMPPQGNLHALAVSDLYDLLRAVFPHPYFIRIQATHRFAHRLAVEPDLAVLARRPLPGAMFDDLPLLVVEISDSTVDRDLQAKRLIYAQQNVQEYWVLDVAVGVLNVFRQPQPHASEPGGAYAEQFQLGASNSISPLAAPSASVALEAVFRLK